MDEQPADRFAQGVAQRQAALDSQAQIADQFGIDQSGVATRLGLSGVDQRLTRDGAEAAAGQLRDQFADEADFVDTDDVAADIDRQGLTGEAFLPEETQQEVADRAVRSTADEDEFLLDDDLTAEVGRFGVEEIRTREDRRDDIAQRTQRELAADDEFVEGDDIDVEVGEAGIEAVGFRDGAERDIASRQFEAETPLDDVGGDDLVDTADGFSLADEPQREIAAIDFADETDAVDQFDPQRDIRRTGDGFALADPGERRVAAQQFADEIDLFDELDPDDGIRRADDGSLGLSEPRARELGAAELDEEVDEIEIEPDDIDLEFADDGSFDVEFEGRI